MMTCRCVVLVLAMAGFLGGCAAGGSERDGGVKFRLSDGVVRIIEQEGRIDLAGDPRVACVEDRVTGWHRMIRMCATLQEFRSDAWRRQFGNISSVGQLSDLQYETSAIIQ